jgi:hypothetical protein
VTLLEACAAYAARMRPGQAFSHSTAAQLLDLPLPRAFETMTPLHVVAVRPAAEPRAAGVVGHRLARQPRVVEAHGLPVCAPEEVWCQLGSMLAVDDLVIAADALLHMAGTRADEWLRALRSALDDGRWAGAPSLREALAFTRPRCWSPGESRIRLVLVRAGLPEPELNGVVVGEDGAFLGTADMVWRGRKVLLEYEGARHGSDEEQFRYDVERYERFRDAGWIVLRATADDLRSATRRAALARRVARYVLG